MLSRSYRELGAVVIATVKIGVLLFWRPEKYRSHIGPNHSLVGLLRFDRGCKEGGYFGSVNSCEVASALPLEFEALLS